MNFERLYEYRFRGIDQASRQAVWNEIGRFVYQAMGSPQRVLDPAAGRAEFMRAIPHVERWLVDQVAYPEQAEMDGELAGVKTVCGDILSVELPEGYFDGIFVSNFLEHLNTQEEVAKFLAKMHRLLAPGGRLAVIGPNFKYCADEYFDCADHTLALTDVSVREHLYAAGFEIERSEPRFLPYSFRSRLPPSPTLTRAYLKMPLAWPIFGKQFFILGRRAAT